MKTILILFISLLIISQCHSENSLYFKKKIVLPDEVSCELKKNHSDFMILIFIDGSCSKCIGQTKVIKNLTSDLPENFEYLIVFYNANKFMPYDYIQKQNANVYIDVNNNILIMNRIITKMKLNSIIIDRNSKIVEYGKLENFHDNYVQFKKNLKLFGK